MERFQIETSKIDLKDSRIFKAVFVMFYPRIYAFALRLLRNEMVSADIVQEAFLYMWQKAYCFMDIVSFKSYLYSCVKNKCLNYIRDNRQERNMEGLENVCIDEEVAIDHLMIEQELRARILEEVNKLPGIKRDIILLRLEGSSYDEISKELRLSINTVKAHKKQAYRELKIRLSDYDKYVFLLVVVLMMLFR